MMPHEQLQARDTKRDIGAELLAAVKELQAGNYGRQTRFEPLVDGSVRRSVTLADGTVKS